MSAHLPDTDLFSPVRLGPYQLANRIAMAPLTRSRAGTGDVPRAITAEYYAQRAGAGLIISEATNISPQGKGYAFTPGIYSAEQVEAWKAVTQAVHARGGHIFLQLWHVGRISHPDLQPGGTLPVAPSAVRPNIEAFTEQGMKPAVIPRALDIAELPGIVDDYRRATENALKAGFDGVEVHAANGYLLDQFLRDGANKRTDAYGGSIENRLRFPLEVTAAVAAVAGSDRVGIRISPINTRNDLVDSNPQPLFVELVERLNPLKLAYLHIIEGVTGGPREVEGGFDLAILRRRFNGLTILNNGYTRDMALAARASDAADLVAFGKPFIANPDLVERLKRNAPLAEVDAATLYGGDAKGYIDYPALEPA